MIVPTPTWRRDQIAGLHRQRLAFDDRGGAVPFDHEADRAHRMTMRGGELAGLHHLRAHEQRVRGTQFQLRVLIADKSPKGFFGTNESSGLVQGRANLLPLPKKRFEVCLGLAKASTSVRNRPVADQVLLFEFLVQVVQRHSFLALARHFKSQISDLTGRIPV